MANHGFGEILLWKIVEGFVLVHVSSERRGSPGVLWGLILTLLASKNSIQAALASSHASTSPASRLHAGVASRGGGGGGGWVTVSEDTDTVAPRGRRYRGKNKIPRVRS